MSSTADASHINSFIIPTEPIVQLWAVYTALIILITLLLGLYVAWDFCYCNSQRRYQPTRSQSTTRADVQLEMLIQPSHTPERKISDSFYKELTFVLTEKSPLQRPDFEAPQRPHRSSSLQQPLIVASPRAFSGAALSALGPNRSGLPLPPIPSGVDARPYYQLPNRTYQLISPPNCPPPPPPSVFKI